METRPDALRRNLGLMDVFAISTGAMISSGFFLLPGLAFLSSGPSLIVAYLLSGILILPAMFAVAEMSTALPRSGGAYFFLDRALGPMTGTVAGLGTWLGLIFKTAFALIGGGAYLALVFDVPMLPIATALAVVFMALNVLGAKETARLQRVLVAGLLVVLAVVLGAAATAWPGQADMARLTPLQPEGWEILMSTVGLVFVSYMGLTKVASVAEEVQEPGRNIPLGMGLSLLVTTLIYVLGVGALVALIPSERLGGDLTPIATLGSDVLGWSGVALVVFAALAAFASTANAGILSASRYLLAMARDRLISERFGELSSRGTPVRGVVLSTLGVVAALVIFDVASVAKLASAFQLLIFALLCLALIVLRESGIAGYAPRFKTPLYPWLPMAGIVISTGLILTMGMLAITFVLGVSAACVAWFFWYARYRQERRGALLHWFHRLGAARDGALADELRDILRETAPNQSADAAVATALDRAIVLDARSSGTFRDVVRLVVDQLRSTPGFETSGTIAARLTLETGSGSTPVMSGVALPHLRLDSIDRPTVVLVRARHGVEVLNVVTGKRELVQALLFVFSPENAHEQHLKLLAALAAATDSPGFLGAWLTTPNAEGLVTLIRERSAHGGPSRTTPLGDGDGRSGELVGVGASGTR